MKRTHTGGVRSCSPGSGLRSCSPLCVCLKPQQAKGEGACVGVDDNAVAGGNAGMGSPSTVPQRKQRDEQQEERKKVMRAARIRDQLKGIPVLEDVVGAEMYGRYQKAMTADPPGSEPLMKAVHDSGKLETLYMWPVAAGHEFASNVRSGEFVADLLAEKSFVLQGFQDCIEQIQSAHGTLLESKVGVFATKHFSW